MLDDLTLDASLVDGADAVVVECPPVDGPVVDAAERIIADLLAFLRGWLADERLAGTRLVITTRNAVAAVDGDPATGLAHAPVWGMMRSAQAEHPDRGLTLLDLDDRTPGAHVVGQALGSDQPQLAARDGRLLAPRLERATTAAPVTPDPDGTVLVSGDLGKLGAIVGAHLIRVYGVRHLLLLGRRGAEGAEAVVGELTALGASTTAPERRTSA
ncbi:hypothetical protein ACFXKI_25770 [Streptomyces mirabilis]|uniref:SpnB-like Rossmann fold domain-containing protein n=1 Tax=Streptomyces mirabilis TaxID=68239 RepID=UPI0036BE6FDC